MKIKAEQRDVLKRHIKDLDGVIATDDINELLLAIDDAIVGTFDSEGNPSQEGTELQKVYDDIYNN